jgi:hypothetical protein
MSCQVDCVPGSKGFTYVCKCGAVFKRRGEILKHVAEDNPWWPKVKAEDQHRIKEVRATARP